MRGTGASTISRRDEGREAMNGCHQIKGWRRSLSVNSKEDGEGESKREFSWKRWRRRSYNRSKEILSNRFFAKYCSASVFVKVLMLIELRAWSSSEYLSIS